MSVAKADHIEDLLAAEGSTQSKQSNGYIYKEYGGFHRFMISYGLRIWNPEDMEEAQAIATEMRRADEQEAREAKRACTQVSSPAQPNSSNSSAPQPAASTKLPAAKSTIRKPSSKSSTKASTTKPSAVRGEFAP